MVGGIQTGRKIRMEDVGAVDVGQLVCVAGEFEGSDIEWWLARVIDTQDNSTVVVEWLEEVENVDIEGHSYRVCDKDEFDNTPISVNTVICAITSTMYPEVVESNDPGGVDVVGDGGVWMSDETWVLLGERASLWTSGLTETRKTARRPGPGRLFPARCTTVSWEQYCPTDNDVERVAALFDRCRNAIDMVSVE